MKLNKWKRASVGPRGGYAVIMVLVFIVLLLSLVGVAQRNLAATLRSVVARAAQIQGDEGVVTAAARALALLETGLPPGSPYTCGVSVSTSAGLQNMTVVFTLEEGTTWQIVAAPAQPGENPPPMPSTFAAAPQ